jgi:hypothetical protein
MLKAKPGRSKIVMARADAEYEYRIARGNIRSCSVDFVYVRANV